MADTKISALTELATQPDPTDEFVLVDKSDNAMGASGTDKRIQYTNLLPVLGFFGTSVSVIASAPASTVTGVANTWYTVRLGCAVPATFTGIRYRVGTAASGNLRCALYDNTGTKVADKTADLAQSTALATQNVPFDSTYALTPGLYIALLWFSSATATFMGGRHMHGAGTGTNATTTPTSVSIPSGANAERPIAVLY